VITLTQPALRERMSDIPLLTEHYLSVFNEQIGKSIKGFDASAMQAMLKYLWPGNVRELINVIERSVVLTKGEYIHVHDLPEQIRQEQSYALATDSRMGNGSLKSALANPERQIIIEALEANGWNRQTARKRWVLTAQRSIENEKIMTSISKTTDALISTFASFYFTQMHVKLTCIFFYSIHSAFAAFPFNFEKRINFTLYT